MATRLALLTAGSSLVVACSAPAVLPVGEEGIDLRTPSPVSSESETHSEQLHQPEQPEHLATPTPDRPSGNAGGVADTTNRARPLQSWEARYDATGEAAYQDGRGTTRYDTPESMGISSYPPNPPSGPFISISGSRFSQGADRVWTFKMDLDEDSQMLTGFGVTLPTPEFVITFNFPLREGVRWFDLAEGTSTTRRTRFDDAEVSITRTKEHEWSFVANRTGSITSYSARRANLLFAGSGGELPWSWLRWSAHVETEAPVSTLTADFDLNPRTSN